MVERAKGIIDIETKGALSLNTMSNLVTGINQGLELTAKIMGTVTRATKQFIDTGSQFEQFTVQFETLLGSVGEAETRMKSLFAFATSTPFELPDVVEAAKSLEAYGLFSERTLRAAGDAAAAFGKDFNETALAIAGAATGEMERLKQFGITSAAITEQLGHEMVRNTTEGLAEIADAVVEIFEKKAGGGMERLTATMGGMVSNLSDSWTRFKLNVSDAKVFQTVKDLLGAVLKTVNELFDSGQAERAAMIIGETLSDLLMKATVGIIAAARATLVMAGQVADLVDRITFEPPSSQGAMNQILGFFSGTSAANVAAGRGAGQFAAGTRSLAAGDFVGPTQDRFGGAIGVLDALMRNIEGMGGGGRGAALTPTPTPGAISDTEIRGGGLGMPSFDLEETEEILFEVTDMQAAAAERTIAAWASARDIMQTGWSTFYTQTAVMGANWVKTGKLQWSDLGKAAKSGVAAVAAAFLQQKQAEWAISAAGAAVDAIMAFPNMAIVGSKLAAAAGYTALVAGAGIASGVIGQSMGGGVAPAAVPSSPQAGGGGQGFESASDQPGTRQISRTVGVRAQNINIHNTIVHNSAAVYGIGGLAQMFEDELVPMIQDAFDSGALNAG